MLSIKEFVTPAGNLNLLGFLFPPDKDIKGSATINDFVPEGQWWTNDPKLC